MHESSAVAKPCSPLPGPGRRPQRHMSGAVSANRAAPVCHASVAPPQRLRRTWLALVGALAVAAPAQQVVSGLDVWYVDGVGRRIHRVDPSNGVEIANFAIPAALVTPAGLSVTGSPGGARALWLLDSTTDQLWRLSPLDGSVLNIVPTPTGDSIGVGSGFIVPGNDEEVFVVDANGLVFWISPTNGDVLHTCDLGVAGIRDAAAFPLGAHGTGLCILRDIDPGGCEILCFNKISCRWVMAHTYPWEGWGLGNRTVGTTAGTATELYASDLNANVLHVLRASDGFELRTIPTVVNGADIRGVGGDCMSPPSQDLCPIPNSFSTGFGGNIFLGAPSLDPGACVYFDLDVAAGLTITGLGIEFLNDGSTQGSITVPNLIGTPASVQVWVVDTTGGLNGGSVAANLPRTYMINPLVLPAAPWNPAGPDATGTLVVADVGQPSLTTSLTPLHLAAGSYGVCIVMVPNGTSTTPPATAGPSSRLHPVFAQSAGGITAISDQIFTLMPRGLSSIAFGSRVGLQLAPDLLVDYTLDPGTAHSMNYGTGCYDLDAPSLAAVARPRHGATLQLRCDNLDVATLAVMTFLSLAPIPNGIDLGLLGMPGCTAHILGPWLAEGLDLSLGAPSVVATFGTIPPIGPLDVYAQAAALTVASPPWNSLNVQLSSGLCLHVDAN